MKRITLFFALFLFSFRLFAGVESIANVTGTDKGSNVTLPAPINSTVFAGTFKATIDGNDVRLYCIDLMHSLAYNQPYQDVEATNDTLSYILNNYYPFKSSYPGMLADVKQEAAAIQIALWHFTDGLNISGISGTNSTIIKNRAQEIVDDAKLNAMSFNLSYFYFDIIPQTFSLGNPVQFMVKAFNDKGIAMENVSISLSVDQGILNTTSVVTDFTGVSSIITLTPEPGQTAAHISATGVVGIPSGTKYYHVADPNGKQKIILATPTIASRTISSNINWFETINVVVNKTANKEIVNHGDLITYTITAKNIGTGNASTVLVSDQLQPILDFVSCVPSGVYNPSSGIWTVGSLNAGDSASLDIVVRVNYNNSNATTFDFGIAKEYNLFVLDTLIQPSSDTEGKLAVGGYADLRGYSVGDKLPPNSGNVLVVGNHLTFITGRVYNGKAIYKDFITTTTGFSADDGIFRDSIINFAQAKIYLEDLSNQLATFTQTDTNKFEWGHLELIGTDEYLNVFNVNGNLLSAANNFTIDAPAGATVIVNVYGDSVSLFGGFQVLNTDKKNVILNFVEATYLKVSGIDVRAAVLAPKAKLDFPAGLITGQVVVKSMYGAGQINLSLFEGVIRRDTSIANVATVVTANQSNMPVLFNSIGSVCIVNSVQNPSDVNNDVKIESYNLEQNYPNPFNPSTSITFTISQNEFVNISVYDITGQMISTLVNSELKSGKYSISFDASNLSSGIYFYRMTTSSFVSTKKMILQK